MKLKPIDYLRQMARGRRRNPLGEPTQADVDRVLPLVERALETAKPAPAPVPTPKPLPTLGWTNPVHTNGACVHDVIYSSCNCPATNIRTQTKTAGFHADQA